ncbi:outer membrane lipoprotein-sorting protein [Desulfospira joergensenii]|uniref:outer membrane lipoprotein-sorting protein n=1 Tax=Desulfospira joergensenii TaxID=53329 RepID=UPI0003B6A223|nr:outer membrane lipoprotein-sorting protein [Desulfospira joergensenii]
MRNYNLFISVVIIVLASSCNLCGQEITGKKLSEKIFNRDRGKDSFSVALMIIVSKSGTEKKREFISKRVMVNGLEKQILRFTSPADIDGTGFLTIEKQGWETEQFLYLPALRRTRRIVSSQKVQRFVNSDFTYEDMERQPVDNYVYKIVGFKNLGGLDCHILETRPKKGIKSQYSLTESLVSKKSFVPLLVRYFDKKGNHIKTYKVLKLELIQNIWTASTVSMEDIVKGHKTYIKLNKIEYNIQIDPANISRKTLELP